LEFGFSGVGLRAKGFTVNDLGFRIWGIEFEV